MKSLIFLIIEAVSISFLTSCMPSTNIHVLRSADIFVPENIQKVAIVNRTKPADGSKLANFVEGLLTGERLFEDRMATQDCLFGLRDALISTPRFSVVQPPMELEGTGGSYLPVPLSWQEVDKICSLSKADGLITLELFDSDTQIGITENLVKTKNKEGKETTVTEYLSNMHILIRSGWRFYDPKSKLVIDEKLRSDFQNYSAKGASKAEATRALMVRGEAIKKTGYFSGNQYGSHISPSWITITRFYYKKGSDILKEGCRLSRQNNWNGAAEIWKKELTNIDKKIAGRACVNIALACEVQGKLELAQEWANKGWNEFGNKKAKVYSAQLNYLIDDKKRVDEQLKKTE